MKVAEGFNRGKKCGSLGVVNGFTCMLSVGVNIVIIDVSVVKTFL